MQCSAEMMNEYRLHLEQDDERGTYTYLYLPLHVVRILLTI